MKPVNIPPGYMADPKGHLVPVELVKQVDLDRDSLVRELVNAALAQNELLADFKAFTLERLEEFLASSAKRYKVKLAGAKGNYTLQSFDGAFQIKVQRQPNITFNESLQIAKELVDQCISAWSEGSDPKIRALVNDAFAVDQESKVSVGKILGLRKLDIQDAKWKKAMEAITSSIQISGSKDYIRFYQRDEQGAYQPISLDLAVV